jgi:hypothetical protein
MIGDQVASGASPALVGEPGSVAEHEVIDEELRTPSEEVGRRGATSIGLESIHLVDPNPRQLVSPTCQIVAAACEVLLRFEQLAPRRQPLFTFSGNVCRHCPCPSWAGIKSDTPSKFATFATR